jgi:Crp-like helix-turn-helix domain
MNCTVAYVDHTAIRELCAAYPRLNRALWRWTLVDAAVLREWIINVGHRPALARLAYVFCEVMLRQNEVGRAFNNACAFPFTQLALAEVTGMSTVHLNRSLQELRGRKLIKFDGQISMRESKSRIVRALKLTTCTSPTSQISIEIKRRRARLTMSSMFSDVYFPPSEAKREAVST